MPLTRLPLTSSALTGTLGVSNGGTGVTTQADMGNFVLLSSATSTTAVSQIDLDFSSDYDEYKLYFQSTPVTDNVDMILRAFVDGTIQTGNVYGYEIHRLGNTSTFSANTDGEMFLTATAGQGNQTDEGGGIELAIAHVNSTQNYKKFYWLNSFQGTTNAHLGEAGTGVYYSNANTLSGIRLLYTSGNIARYDYRLYGLRK
jgi:hypothetical protein